MKKLIIPSILLLLAIAAGAYYFDLGASRETKRDRYLANAQAYIGAEKTQEAIIELKNALKLDPGHADGWRGLGAAVAAHDTARAVAAWQRVMELDPQDFDTLYNLGMTLADAGRRNEAASYLRRFLAEAPRDRYAKDLPRVRATLTRLDKPS